MSNKPQLSFWQIWNMSFGFLGIQFGMGLQMANMSPIFSFLDAKEEDLSLLWLAAPLTGLIVQPIVGYMSDRTWTGLGRRRPYFLVGAILASIALVLMPQSSALWMAVGLLWILDASLNITMEPFRAFVADKLPLQQRSTGFSVQSLLIGLGAVVASVMPWMLTNWLGVESGAAEGSAIPRAVTISFQTGAAVLFVAVVYTIFTTPEYPPEDMEAFRKMKAESRGMRFFFVELGHGLKTMPPTMRQLAVVQFFTWLALFCMWVFWAPAIARHVFGGDPSDSENWKLVMEEAGAWTGVCFGLYNGVCAAFAFVLLRWSRIASPKLIHICCLIIGALGLLSALVIDDHRMLLASMTGVGIAWASILSMPYAILSSALPPAKMGFYMGVFNFFIVIPQVLVSLGMGKLIGLLFNGDSMMAIVIAGVCWILAAAAMLRVDHAGDAAEPSGAAGH